MGKPKHKHDWMTDHDVLVDHLANIASLIGWFEFEVSAKEAVEIVQRRRKEEGW